MADATRPDTTAAAAPGWLLAPHYRALVRRAGDLSYAELGGRIGMSPQLLGRYARGVKVPKPATLRRLLKAVGATKADLMAARPEPIDYAPPAGAKRPRPRRKPKGGGLSRARRGDALRALVARSGVPPAELAVRSGLSSVARLRQSLNALEPGDDAVAAILIGLGATEADLADLA